MTAHLQACKANTNVLLSFYLQVCCSGQTIFSNEMILMDEYLSPSYGLEVKRISDSFRILKRDHRFALKSKIKLMKFPITLSLIIFLGIGIVATPSFSQSNNGLNNKIVAKGASLTQVASDYKFTEGPAADADGNVYFTDQPNNRILRWSPEKGVEVYMENAGRANGLYFDHQGNLLACADQDNQLWRIGPEKSVKVLIKDFGGKKLNGPNDLWVDPKGGIYFTDPFYKRKYWTRTEKEIEQENVYYLSPAMQLKVVADDLVRPNGIIGTSDGKTLYVADINDKKTYRYRILPDGSLSDKTLFTNMGSDGMTLDQKGNVYLTGKGVTVFNKKGDKIAQIDIDENWTANVCFGGKQRKTLFITAMKSVYTLDMKVKGAK